MSTVTVGELIDAGFASIQTGPFGTQLKAAEYTNQGRPLLNVRNVGFGDVRSDDLEFVSDTTAERLRAHILQAEDIVFGRKGAVERHAFIPVEFAGSVQGSDCIRLRLDRRRVLPRFASFAFRTKSHLAWMQNQCSHGATMASLNQEIVRRIQLPVLPLSAQMRVIEVLGAIDDLIANNRRGIALLEEMALETYREWLVHFRYPGHEDDELVDSPLGLIPIDWEVSPISEVVEVFGGGTPSKKEPSYWDDGTITWFTPSDLTKARSMFMFSSANHITAEGLAHSSARLFPPRSVLMTSRATLGVIAISAVEGCTNQGFIVCVPNGRLSEFHLYFWLLENVSEFEALASGATFKEITRGAFRKFPIAIPAAETQQAFTNSVGPIGGNIERLTRLNLNLHHLRDMLLPKLVSGAIDVSKLDLDTLLEESAA
jgi:type I restriction enzyme, S subunit